MTKLPHIHQPTMDQIEASARAVRDARWLLARTTSRPCPRCDQPDNWQDNDGCRDPACPGRK
jgi:hypothetical protein